MENIRKSSINDIKGTSFHNGLVRASAIQIGNCFGTFPLLETSDKTTFEWRLIYESPMGDIPFTIYDYNEDAEVIGDDELDYHIGTQTKEHTNIIVNMLNEQGLCAHVQKFPWDL